MCTFKQAVEEAVRSNYALYYSDKGVASTYYSETGNIAIVQALELDGTSEVHDYMAQLARQLPAGYRLSHNSPTDGQIYITDDDIGAVKFDRYIFLTHFKELFKLRLLGTLKGHERYRIILEYAVSYYERSDRTIDSFLSLLNPDEEILQQLIALDFDLPKSALKYSLLHWEKLQDSWFISLPNGLTLCGSPLWVFLSRIGPDQPGFGELGFITWVSNFTRLEPAVEDNLYYELKEHMDTELAGKCAADLILIYNK